jgi:hypothetical protein
MAQQRHQAAAFHLFFEFASYFDAADFGEGWQDVHVGR